MNLIKKFLKNEEGLETVEYAIIIGLIVGGLVLVVATIGTWVNTRFENLRDDLASTTPAP